MPDSAARSAFPGILKRYMERDNLSRVDIANSLKVSKQTVSDWVCGKKFPRVDRMQKLADLFGVLMSEMYTDTGVPSQCEESCNDVLSSDEQFVVDTYRTLSDPGKQYIHQQLTIASHMFGGKSEDTTQADHG